MAEPVKAEDLDPQTRARAKKALHEANAKKRELVIEQTKADFQTNRENPVVIAIIEKAKALSALHLQMAKDGVGVRASGERNEQGELVSETIFFTKDKRITELDKSAGLDELTDWIARQFGTLPQPVLIAPATEDEAEDDAEVEAPAEGGPAAPTDTPVTQ